MNEDIVTEDFPEYMAQREAQAKGLRQPLVQIGTRLFNPAQIALVYLSTKSVIIEFAVQDGDQPLNTAFRGDDRRDFLAWLESGNV